MLSLALLLGKFLFLAVLYLFVLMVVRAGDRDLKAPAGALGSPGRLGRADRRAALPVTDRPPFSASAEGLPVSPSPLAGSAPGRAAPGAKAWALVVDAGPALPAGSAFTIYSGERVVIGRAPDSDIVLEDTFVSSRHASVTAGDDGLVVEDLGSTNGTLVGGLEVEGRLFVGPGATVAIGDSVFVVEER